MTGLREHHWRCDVDGYTPVTTDELTLDEVELVEKVSGQPWVLINPATSLKCAKALLVVMLVRAGASEDDALKKAAKTPLQKIKGAFTYVEGNAPLDGGEESSAGPPSSAPTSATG